MFPTPILFLFYTETVVDSDDDVCDVDAVDTSDEDEVDTDEDVEADNVNLDDYEDEVTEDESDDNEADGENGSNNERDEDVNDAANEEKKEDDFSELKLRTICDAESVVKQLKLCYTRCGLIIIGGSDTTYSAADRSSVNVKANGDMPTEMISGVLHGMSNVIKVSIKTVTSETIGKRGSKERIPNEN